MTLTREESEQAVRDGAARAIADLGMTPSEAERYLAINAKRAAGAIPQLNPKRASFLSGIINMLNGIRDTGKKTYDDVKGLGKDALLLGGGIGIAGGILSAKARSKFDDAVNGEDDPEIAKIDHLTRGYSAMGNDLKDTLESRQIANG